MRRRWRRSRQQRDPKLVHGWPFNVRDPGEKLKNVFSFVFNSVSVSRFLIIGSHWGCRWNRVNWVIGPRGKFRRFAKKCRRFDGVIDFIGVLGSIKREQLWSKFGIIFQFTCVTICFSIVVNQRGRKQNRNNSNNNILIGLHDVFSVLR